MEDPWGSPWAADSPPKIDLPAPPPHAHFSVEHVGLGHRNNTSPQRVSPARSPWDDDDAWGGWNDGKDAGTPWGRSPGLRPLDSAASSTRAVSPASGLGPDAWGGFAAEKRREERHADSAVGERERGRTEVTTSESKINAEDIWRSPDPEPPMAGEDESPSPPTSDDDEQPNTPDIQAPKAALPPGTSPAAPRQSSKVQELVEMYDGMAKRIHSVSPTPIEQPPRRRVDGESPAESPKESEFPQDELREELQHQVETGDEELSSAEPCLADVPEQVLTVEATPVEQEVSDCLEPESDPESEPEHEVPLDPTVENQEEPHADEESEDEDRETPSIPGAESSHQEERDSKSQEGQLSPPLPSDATVEKKEGPEAIHSQEHDQGELPVNVDGREVETEPSQTEAPSAAPYRTQTKIPFSIDLSKLDELFPNVETSFPTQEPLPDIIIDDTFASISERKAWYRISRPGSMRKHNMGDDENYVRISWDSSHIRDQGISTVRRWMEEDSMGSRKVLGRRAGAAGGKIFNWDSSAPAVEISALLRRKSHSRKNSVAPKKTTAAHVSPIAASFGWGSTSSPTIALPPPSSDVVTPVEQTASKTKPLAVAPVAKPSSRPVSVIQESVSPTSPPKRAPITIETDTTDDEDDEWGEMVSSRPVSMIQTAAVSPTTRLTQPPTAAVLGDTTQEDEDEDERERETEDEDDDDWGEMVSSPTGDANPMLPSLAEVRNGTQLEHKVENFSSISPTLLPNDLFRSMSSSESIPAGSVGFHSITTPITPSNRLSATMGTLAPLRNQQKGHGASEQPDRWGFESVELLGGISKVSQPVQEVPRPQPTPPPVQKAAEPSFFNRPFTKPLSPVSLPRTSPQTPHPPSARADTSKDDEIVANVLRNLPDLSYMLR